MVRLSGIFQNTKPIESAVQLYKFLLKECQKLPPDASEHYKFQIRQSYKQHAEETDKERVKEIISRAMEDAKWVMDKYKQVQR